MKQKGFKYKVTLKVDLKKYKGTKIEFSSVYFSSPAKSVANHRFNLDKFFKEIF